MHIDKFLKSFEVAFKLLVLFSQACIRQPYIFLCIRYSIHISCGFSKFPFLPSVRLISYHAYIQAFMDSLVLFFLFTTDGYVALISRLTDSYGFWSYSDL